MRGRFEVVLSDFHDMCDFGPELRIDGKAAVQGVPRACGEPEGEFALEHEN